MVLYFDFLKNFAQFVVIHTAQGFGIVNKARVTFLLFVLFNGCLEIDLWFLCVF